MPQRGQQFQSTDDDRSEYTEYKLPGDEPMRHQWDTNVAFDWYRHQPKEEQKRLSSKGDHAEAWSKKEREVDLQHEADSIKKEEDYEKRAKSTKLPGISSRAYYSKARARNIKKSREKKKKAGGS